MKVLVLTRLPQLASMQRLADELRRAGHEPLIQDPEAPDVRKSEPEFVIACFDSARFEESLATLEYFERRKVPVLNKASGLREARHRWMRYLVLREEGVPQPPTRLARKKDFPRVYPFVAKMPEPPNGDGVFNVRGPEDVMALPDIEWILQDLPGDRRERVFLVVDDETFPAGVGAAETRLAKQALNALGLRTGGVRLVSSAEGLLVSEIEGSPVPEDMNPELQGLFAAALARAVSGVPPRAPLTLLKT